MERDDEDEVLAALRKLPPGSLGQQLWVASQAIAAIVPSQRPSRPEGSRRVKMARVRATFKGCSKPHPGSARCAVLLYVQSAGVAAIAVADLEAALGPKVRGHLRKLLEKGHIEVAP